VSSSVPPHDDLLRKTPKGLWIGGEWRDGASGRRFAADDPATGDILAEVAHAEVYDALAAMDAAVAVQADWATTAPRKRSENLYRAYLYTRDLSRALRLTGRLKVGLVGLSRGLVSNPATPFGGVKDRGMGREGGPEGIAEYLSVKYAAIAL
jgi:acyl-CoA reductase-like NAD-dependent aldehyde dehydrogenase